MKGVSRETRGISEIMEILQEPATRRRSARSSAKLTARATSRRVFLKYDRTWA
jgi:hypothetical protein